MESPFAKDTHEIESIQSDQLTVPTECSFAAILSHEQVVLATWKNQDNNEGMGRQSEQQMRMWHSADNRCTSALPQSDAAVQTG